MAWPHTPLTTYVANSTPAIKAADLNAFQTGINGIVNGTYNLQSIQTTTGTPGAVVTAVPGTVLLAAAGSETTWPTASIPKGRVYADTVCLGFARGYWDGAAMVAVRDFNVLSLTRSGVGDYTITFQPTVNSPATAYVLTSAGTDNMHLQRTVQSIAIQDDGMGRVQVRFLMLNASDALVEADAQHHFFIEAKAA